MTDNDIAVMLEMILRELRSRQAPAEASPTSTNKARTWSTSIKQGRVPVWVSAVTGTKDHKVLEMTFGPNATFTEGSPLPQKF